MKIVFKSMNYMSFSTTYIYPMVRFSSDEPDFDNDWSNWSEGQEVLSYDDTVLISLGMNDFSDHDIKIDFLSNTLLKDSNQVFPTIEPFLVNKVSLFKGQLYLKNNILDVGEDFGEFKIVCNTSYVDIEIFGNKDSRDRFELVCWLEIAINR